MLLELLGEEQAKVVIFLSNCSLDAMVELMVDDMSMKASRKQEEKGPIYTLFRPWSIFAVHGNSQGHSESL